MCACAKKQNKRDKQANKEVQYRKNIIIFFERLQVAYFRTKVHLNALSERLESLYLAGGSWNTVHKITNSDTQLSPVKKIK